MSLFGKQMKDLVDYTAELSVYWDTIMRAWTAHGDKHPVIECDLSAGCVGAYPAAEYIGGLSSRTRQATLREYERTMHEGGMIVFVKDSDREVVQSYSFFPEDED